MRILTNFLQRYLIYYKIPRTFVIQLNRGVEQLVARRAHNPEVAGSSPVSATKHKTCKYHTCRFFI